MKQWTPVLIVLLAILLLYPSFPNFSLGILAFILVALLVNKWGALLTYFQ